MNWSGYYHQHKLDAFKYVGLSNSYASIENANTASHIYYFYPTDDFTHDWTWTVDETNVFYHMNVIHDYITGSPFEFDDMDYQMEAEVHAGSGINGLSDGTDIWFGTYGGEDWARSSDVIYHEYTHCIVYQIYGSWIGYSYTSQGYAMDEGISDYFAGSLNNESRIGEYVDLPSYRNLDNDDTMSDYYTVSSQETPYINSTIISGSLWDMRESATIGAALADELLFFALLHEPTEFDGLLDAILEEDDTDADLSNGTPHIDAILYAFDNHEIYSDDPDVPPAAPPLSVNTSGDNPVLSWGEVSDDVEEYKVYRKVVGVADWHLKTTTSNLTWTDTGVLLEYPYMTVYYRVKAYDYDDNASNWSNEVVCYGDAMSKPLAEGLEKVGSIAVPDDLNLMNNYPNPFNPSTIIEFGLPEDNYIKLVVYNIHGQRIAELVNNFIPAGTYKVTFNAENLPSGVYFYKIVAGEFTDIKRMLLIR